MSTISPKEYRPITVYGPQVSPLAMTSLKWKFYMLFVSLNLVDFTVITLFFPETKGTVTKPNLLLAVSNCMKFQAKHWRKWMKYLATHEGLRPRKPKMRNTA